MLKALLGLVTSAAGGLQGYLIAAGIAGILAASATGYVVHRMDEATIQGIKLADAVADQKAISAAAVHQQMLDTATQGAAVAEARAQSYLAQTTYNLKLEIPRYVTPAQDASMCGLTVGFARVMRAAAAGIDPAALNLPPGQSDDACADSTPSEVAGWFADYAGVARANAEQLNAVIALDKATDAIVGP